MREALALAAAIVLTVILSPVVFLFQLIRHAYRRGLRRYLWSVAVGIDQVGGSVLYGKINWTVSGYTWHLAKKGNRYAEMFARFIDFIFGKGHCKEAWRWDLDYNALKEIGGSL